MTPKVSWIHSMNLRIMDEQEQAMFCKNCNKTTIHKLMYASREWACTVCGHEYRGK